MGLTIKTDVIQNFYASPRSRSLWSESELLITNRRHVGRLGKHLDNDTFKLPSNDIC